MADNLKDTDKKTAFNPLKQPTRVGDFSITTMKLTSANLDIKTGAGANFLDLTTSVWHELNFYEDIYSPIVSGDITLTDTVGLIESFPIIGEEILDVSFSTAGAALPPTAGPAVVGGNAPASEAPKQVINRFRVYKVDPPVQVTDNSRTIKLYFVTDSQFTNLLSKVRKIYPTKQNIPNTLAAGSDKTYTLADMARDIFYDFFIGSKKPKRQPKTRKPFLVEPTRYKAEMIIPNWNPFKAISFLASKAVSANHNAKGANFVFYQTLQGFRFISIETLMLGGFRLFQEEEQDAVQKKYPHLITNAILDSATAGNSSHLPIFKDEPEIDETMKPFVASYKYMPANMGEGKQSSYESVTSFRLVDSFDTMKNVALGMYANRVITHDLIQMKIDRKDFHYVTPSSTITVVEADGSTTTETVDVGDKEKIQIDESVSTEIGRLCSDNADFLGRPEAHISLVPTTLGQAGALNAGPLKEFSIGKDNEFEAKQQTVKTPDGFAINEDFVENHVEDVIARRISQRLQLDSVKINFSAPGDSSREVGDLISFDYPTENSKVAATSGRGAGHKYYSGKFLITALRHKITQDEYTIHVEAIKDGYKSAISSTFEAAAPTVQVPNPITGLTEAEATETVESFGIATT
tara:strand:- start:684 stop:2588 length:1905 start_codon:yes stop_codon:yes gene_type:complete